MGDEDLLNRLIECEVPLAKQLGRMLQERRLYKRVDQVGREVVQADKTRNRLEEMHKMFRKDPATRVRVEDEIADLCGLDQGDVLIYCPDTDMNLKAADMLVTWRNDVEPLSEIDDPLIEQRTKGIIESHRNLWQCKVFIHPDKREDKEVLRRAKDFVSCHLRGNGAYGRETIEQVLHELGEKEKILLPVSRIRTVAEKVLAPARVGAPLSRSLLLGELRRARNRKEKRHNLSGPSNQGLSPPRRSRGTR
jgi:hypothetical protein